MIPEKVLYTDGHEVTVTESSFMVKNTMYRLKGIIHHDFLVIHPHRIPSLLVMLIGALTMMLGALNWLPKNSVPSFHFFSITISENMAAIGLGAGLLIAGTIFLSLAKERYAIRLATAEGEKNVLISKRKEYITQILDALNKAFLSLVSPRKEISKNKTVRKFEVGAR